MTGKRRRYLINQPFVRTEREIRVGTNQAVAAEIRKAIKSRRRIWNGVDSARLGVKHKKLFDLHQAQVSFFSKHKGLETMGQEETQALIKDFNGRVNDHQSIIHTSVFGSGISCTVAEHDLYAFNYNSVLTPADMNQMMLRSRVWTEALLGVKVWRRRAIPVAELLRRQVAADRYRARVEGGERQVDPEDLLTRLMNERDAKELRMMRNPGMYLVLLLEMRGNTVEYLADEDFDYRPLEALGEAEYREAVAGATVLSGEEYQKIQKKFHVTLKESAQMEAYSIRNTLELGGDQPLLDEHFDEYGHGRLLSIHRNIALLRQSRAVKTAAIRLLRKAGINLADLTGVVTAKSAAAAWKLMHKAKGGSLLVEHGLLPPFAGRMPRYPTDWVMNFLAKFGLEMAGKQARRNGTPGVVKSNIINPVGVPSPATPNHPPVGRGQRFYTLKNDQNQLVKFCSKFEPEMAPKTTSTTPQNHHSDCWILNTMTPSQADIYNPNLRRHAQEKILQRLAQPQPLPVMQEFVGDDPVKQSVWGDLTGYGVVIIDGTEVRLSGLSLVAAIAAFNVTNQRSTA